MKFKIKKIEDYSLCIGCGLCESLTNGNCQLKINEKGFLVPNIDYSFNDREISVLSRICPAINIKCTPKGKDEFGPIKEGVEAGSTDDIIRFRSASGGAVTSICQVLLKEKIVDGILQVGRCENHYMLNELKISTTPEDVLQCASSRYAPVPVFANIISILREMPDSYFGFVGKPCDIMTMKRLINEYPEFKGKIKYFISIACAGIPSFSATEYLIKKGNPISNPISVKYRGDGWPGNFVVKYEDGTEFKCDYHKSWGEVLGRTLNFRCKICPDGMGADADIVVGDSWNTEDGYPDFSEADGKSFILARTDNGKYLIQLARESNALQIANFDTSNLKKMHQYQFLRLQTSFYKLIAAWICTRGLIRIKGLHIPKISVLKGLKTMIGTIKRF